MHTCTYTHTLTQDVPIVLVTQGKQSHLYVCVRHLIEYVKGSLHLSVSLYVLYVSIRTHQSFEG